MTVIHELKIDHNAFQDVVSGVKPWQLRFNDRNFQIGDGIVLRETLYSSEEMRTNGAPLEWSGRTIQGHITDIEKAPYYGLKDGWAILTVRWHMDTYRKKVEVHYATARD